MGFLSKLFGKKGDQSPGGGRPSGPTFYVFGLQGPAFSAGAAQAGDIMPEKAQTLYALLYELLNNQKTKI